MAERGPDSLSQACQLRGLVDEQGSSGQSALVLRLRAFLVYQRNLLRLLVGPFGVLGA